MSKKDIRMAYENKREIAFFDEALSFPTKEETLVPTTRKGKLKGATLVNLRTIPSLEGTVIGFVEKETEFLILEIAEEWAKINYQNLHFGWIKSQYVEEVS